MLDPCNNGDYETPNVCWSAVEHATTASGEKAFAPATPSSYDDASSCLPALAANVPPRSRRTSEVQHKPCATRFVRTEPT